jgi:Ca2+-binding EF-hand superfamily protein
MKRTLKQTIVAALMAGTALAVAVPVTAQQMNGQPPMMMQKQDGTGPMGQGPQGQGNGMQQGQGMGQAMGGLGMGGAPMGQGPMANGPMGGWMPGFDFATFDADGDGKVTPAEIAARRAAEAAALDANGDGKLSAEELVAADMRHALLRAQARVAARIAAQDADGDGMLSAAELALPPGPQGMFDRLDADNDGAVTQDELAAAEARMSARMGDRMTGRHHDGKGYHDRHGDKRGDRMRGDRGQMGQPGANGPMGRQNDGWGQFFNRQNGQFPQNN